MTKPLRGVSFRAPERLLARVILVFLLSPLPLAAAPLVDRLEYRVADELVDCPSRDEVGAQIGGLLHGDPGRIDPALTVSVSLYPKDAGVGATIALRRSGIEVGGPRHLSLPVRSCRELARTVSLAVAIALDLPADDVEPDRVPTAARAAPPASGARVARPSPSAGKPVVAGPGLTAPVADVAEPAAAARWEAGGRIAVGVGLTPSPAAIAGVGAALHLSRATFRIEVMAGAPGEKKVSGGGVSAWFAGGGVLPCRRFRHLSLCGSFWAALHRGQGMGFLEARGASRLWLGLGVRASIPLMEVAGLDLSLVAEGLRSLRRYRLVDSDSGATFWQMPPVGATLGVALGTKID